MTIYLRLHLVNGQIDYVRINREFGDFSDVMLSLRNDRNPGLMTDEVWYPLHGIVKIEFGWDCPDPDPPEHKEWDVTGD